MLRSQEKVLSQPATVCGNSHTHIHKHSRIHTHAYTLMHSRAHTPTLTLTLMHTHVHTFSLTLSLSHTHSHKSELYESCECESMCDSVCESGMSMRCVCVCVVRICASLKKPKEDSGVCSLPYASEGGSLPTSPRATRPQVAFYVAV